MRTVGPAALPQELGDPHGGLAWPTEDLSVAKPDGELTVDCGVQVAVEVAVALSRR